MINDLNNNPCVTPQNSEHLMSAHSWNEGPYDIIKKWKTIISQKAFIYRFIYDRNKKIMQRLNILAISISSFVALLASIGLWINDENFDHVIDISVIILNFSLSAFSALVKKYSDKIKNDNLLSYVNDLEKMKGDIETQITCTDDFRSNADDFIKIYTKIFNDLINESINISLKDERIAKEAYKKYLENRTNNEV
jgi:hypothetical protein